MRFWLLGLDTAAGSWPLFYILVGKWEKANRRCAHVAVRVCAFIYPYWCLLHAACLPLLNSVYFNTNANI